MELITKPFSVQALAVRIREMIGDSERASRPKEPAQRLVAS
jgi:DNA-binding response OmpR family regulator